MEKLKIRELLNGDVQIESNLDDIIEMLIALRDKLKSDYPEYDDLEIEIDSGYNNHSTEIYGTRLETDQERDDRKNKKAVRDKNNRISRLSRRMKKMSPEEIEALEKQIDGTE